MKPWRTRDNASSGRTSCRSIKQPTAAASCNSSQPARCSPPEACRLSRPKDPSRPQLPDPIMWAPLNTGNLIKNPKDAINVFDFEPVMRQNVPPAHFGYMASGIDDEVTLRANREGFLKFQLRPRRLVDVSKVDMSTEILGVRYDTPIIVAPVGGQKAFHPEGEVAVARAAKAGNHLQILSTADHDRRRGGHRRARGADLVPALRDQQVGGRQGVRDARRESGLPGGRGDGGPQRRPQSGNAVPAAARRDTRDCNACHDRSSLQANLKRRSMYQGVDITGPDPHPVVRHDLGLHQAAARHDQDENRAQGHPGSRGRRARRRRRHGRHHRVEPWRAQRGQRALDHRRAAGDRRSGGGRMPILSTAASAAAPTSPRRCAWARPRVCVGRPYIWGLGAFGQPGVERVLELLRIELRAIMQQVGAPNIKALVPAMVRRAWRCKALTRGCQGLPDSRDQAQTTQVLVLRQARE